MAPISGVMRSAITAWTTALKATPTTTATASSIRLPRNRNFLKPLMQHSPPDGTGTEDPADSTD